MTDFYAGQLLRASTLQAIKDDRLIVTKSGDTSRLSNITLQADPHLTLSLQAGYNYAVEVVAFFNTPAAADIQFALSFPSSTTPFGALRMVDTSAALVGDVDPGAYNSATSGSSNVTAGGTGGVTLAILKATVSGPPASAGALTLLWAQKTSTASNTTLYQGSSMIATRER